MRVIATEYRDKSGARKAELETHRSVARKNAHRNGAQRIIEWSKLILKNGEVDLGKGVPKNAKGDVGEKQRFTLPTHNKK